MNKTLKSAHLIFMVPEDKEGELLDEEGYYFTEGEKLVFRPAGSDVEYKHDLEYFKRIFCQQGELGRYYSKYNLKIHRVVAIGTGLKVMWIELNGFSNNNLTYIIPSAYGQE